MIANVTIAAAGALALAVGARATTDPGEPGTHVGIGAGTLWTPAVSGGVTAFFNYRIDIFLLGFLLVGAPAEVTAAVGLYTLAVQPYRASFFAPDSVSIFFPRVAGDGAARRRRDDAGGGAG